MSDDLTGLSAAQMTRMIGSRAISPSELVDAFLDRIEKANPSIAAFAHVTATRARSEAKARTEETMRGESRGVLHGIPFAVKDIIDVLDVPTKAGSRLSTDRPAPSDAACVARMSAAGAIVLGKTATYEFATGGPSFDLPWPPTRNPWNLDHAPGGSSAGSGAAVAAGLVPMALGSDTGGSVRVPASFCGVTGFKPTFGRLDNAGVLPLAPTFDTLGILARTAEDAALWLRAVDTGNAELALSVATNGSMRGLKIGIVRHLYDGADAELAVALDEAESVFRSQGAIISEVSLPALADFGDCLKTIVGAEAFAIHRKAIARSPSDFGEVFRYRVLPGMLVQGSGYVAAHWMRGRLIDTTLAALAKVDVLLTATTLDSASAFSSMSLRRRLKPFLTAPFSVTGLPAICLCIGFSSHGLPLSMQIVGRPHDDAVVLRAAHGFQQETAWHTQRPDLETARPAPTSRTPDWTPEDLDTNPATESVIDSCLARHGIRLSSIQHQQLCEGAAAMISATERVRNNSIH